MNSAQAYQTILGATAVIFALIAQSMVARRFQTRKHEETTAKLDAVQTLVNGTADKQSARIDQLEQTITHSGATLPPSPLKEEA